MAYGSWTRRRCTDEAAFPSPGAGGRHHPPGDHRGALPRDPGSPGRLRHRHRRPRHQRSVPRPGQRERPRRRGGEDARAPGTSERRRLPPQSRRARAHYPHRAGIALRARQGRGACRADRGAAGVDPPGGTGLIGALLVDKPAGLTSHDAVQRVRRALRTRQAGHTGTLDPFATGLLVVLVGRATRLAQFVESEAKTYLATARLGVRTETDDLTGAVIDERPVGRVGLEQVREALAGFAGEQQQRPPVYSAKHVAGERSYRLARRGVAVE